MTSTELKVMEVLDLFMRDASLGQFQARLAFMHLLKAHFNTKLLSLKTDRKKLTALMRERVTKVLNIMDFVCAYYSQFSDRLRSTLARLD